MKPLKECIIAFKPNVYYYMQYSFYSVYLWYDHICSWFQGSILGLHTSSHQLLNTFGTRQNQSLFRVKNRVLMLLRILLCLACSQLCTHKKCMSASHETGGLSMIVVRLSYEQSAMHICSVHLPLLLNLDTIKYITNYWPMNSSIKHPLIILKRVQQLTYEDQH